MADNFESHNTDDPALQDPQVKWILLPPNCTAVHQPLDQGIIAALKANYKSKLLHIMVKNLENYDQLRQFGAALTASVRGIDHAYPPNLLDAGTLAYQAWDSLTQATLANCRLKADILPPLHTAQLHQNTGRYHQQCTSSAIKDLCTLLLHGNKLGQQKVCIQWKNMAINQGYINSLEEWLLIRDTSTVCENMATNTEIHQQLEEHGY